MDLIDRVAYVVKGKLPCIYDGAALVGRAVTILLYHRTIARVSQLARVEGTVSGRHAVMRLLTPKDVGRLTEMIAAMPEEHLKFFRPHGLDPSSLLRVLSRRDVMTYGLLVGDEICAYAILKLFPTKRAYVGRLVSPAMAGLGIGKYLSRFLYWQACLLGFQPCSTIHRDNVASLRSHASVRPFVVAAELPEGYRLVRFELLPEDATPPMLRIE